MSLPSSGAARQPDLETSPFVRRAVDLDAPGVSFDDLLNDGQAKARAMFLRGEERVEDVGANGFVHAVAAVANGQAYPVAGSVHDRIDADLELSAPGHSVARIQAQ